MPTKVLSQLDLSNQKIINLLDPTVAQDGATKNYVDLYGELAANLLSVSLVIPAAASIVIPVYYEIASNITLELAQGATLEIV